jgi:hypothetical protein
MDELKIKVLIDALKGGADINTASQFAGLNYSTVFMWIERGQRENQRIEAGLGSNEEETEFLDLWQRMRKARAEAIVRNITQVQKAGQQGDWKAAAWWLERTLPEQYAIRRNEPKPLSSGDDAQ